MYRKRTIYLTDFSNYAVFFNFFLMLIELLSARLEDIKVIRRNNWTNLYRNDVKNYFPKEKQIVV